MTPKIIDILGDSITEGALASTPDKNFVNLLAKHLNCKVINHGISGTRIAYQKPGSLPIEWDAFYGSRVKDLDKNADLVIVFGGTNDFGHGFAPIGQIGDKSPDTFCGAVDYLVTELLKKYNKKQIVFLLPLYRLNDNNPMGDGVRPSPTLPLQGYRDIMSEIVKSYDIDVFDVKDLMGRPEDTDLYADGLHPNDKGHAKLAEILADFVTKRK